MFKFFRLVVFTAVAVSGAIVTAKAQAFRLANVLQSNMVIQQNKPFHVWGIAKPGDHIKIDADWASHITTTVADANGNWVGDIKVPKAIPGDFKPHTLVVMDGDNNIKLDNLLIGDLWFCVGQSNMDMPLGAELNWTYRGALNFEKEVAAANYPNIRLYRSDWQFRSAPSTDNKGTWHECSPESVKGFSAVAYFFGRKLYQKLNIPIGLVVSAIPGAGTQAFVKREVLENDTMLKRVYLDPYQNVISTQKKVDSLGLFPSVTKPTLIYNAIIYPMFNLSIKGMIYYQGESNITDKREHYIPLFTAMVADFRSEFKQGNFPFYYTQIAPYREEHDDTTAFKAAIFKETQEKLLSIKNTGMAVTMDVGEERNVHPRDKKPVGERLANIALNKTYHQHTAYQGPHFTKFEMHGSEVTVYFKKESIGSGLTTNDGKAPRHFFVAGDDHKFYWANAKIVGDNVILSSDKVTKPIAVRYAFTDGAVTNLENREGLPAVPFRTDNWQ
ncbi:MAG: sialate O-acetylesterase [Mucilaginibacter sp.]